MILFHLNDDPCYFLSNFYPWVKFSTFRSLDIEFENQKWPSSEHIYQALKFKGETKEEKEWREIIRKAPTPTISKYLGHQWTHERYGWQKKYADLVRKYRPLVRTIDNFESSLFDIMFIAVKAKFASPELKKLLLDTYPEKLGENTKDKWGYFGDNWLGITLEKVREHYKLHG